MFRERFLVQVHNKNGVVFPVVPHHKAKERMKDEQLAERNRDLDFTTLGSESYYFNQPQKYFQQSFTLKVSNSSGSENNQNKPSA